MRWNWQSRRRGRRYRGRWRRDGSFHRENHSLNMVCYPRVCSAGTNQNRRQLTSFINIKGACFKVNDYLHLKTIVLRVCVSVAVGFISLADQSQLFVVIVVFSTFPRAKLIGGKIFPGTLTNRLAVRASLRKRFFRRISWKNCITNLLTLLRGSMSDNEAENSHRYNQYLYYKMNL